MSRLRSFVFWLSTREYEFARPDRGAAWARVFRSGREDDCESRSTGWGGVGRQMVTTKTLPVVRRSSHKRSQAHNTPTMTNLAPVSRSALPFSAMTETAEELSKSPSTTRRSPARELLAFGRAADGRLADALRARRADQRRRMGTVPRSAPAVSRSTCPASVAARSRMTLRRTRSAATTRFSRPSSAARMGPLQSGRRTTGAGWRWSRPRNCTNGSTGL